jgi:hypothetical protein
MSIMIMGIMASIAIAIFSQPHRQAIIDSTDRHNAALLVTMANCAEIAGISPVVPGNLEATVRRLMIGVTPTTGILRGRKFVVNGIPEDRLSGVLTMLELRNDQLVIKSAAP